MAEVVSAVAALVFTVGYVFPSVCLGLGADGDGALAWVAETGHEGRDVGGWWDDIVILAEGRYSAVVFRLEEVSSWYRQTVVVYEAENGRQTS